MGDRLIADGLVITRRIKHDNIDSEHWYTITGKLLSDSLFVANLVVVTAVETLRFKTRWDKTFHSIYHMAHSK